MAGVDARLTKAGKSPKPTRREPRGKRDTPQEQSFLGESWSPSSQRCTVGGDWGIVYSHSIPLRERLRPAWSPDSGGPPPPRWGAGPRSPAHFASGAKGPRRGAMSKSIFVGNLSDEVTSGDLAEAFAKFGTVTRAQVATDRDTGRSRGFGFVVMSEGGERAIAGLNGSHFHGQALVVSE